jgi:hypothetical protein
LLTSKEWNASDEVAEIILESALLPILEQSFRSAWLDMQKAKEVYGSYLALVRAMATQPKLLQCLDKIDAKYKPTQRDSIYVLVGKVNELGENVLKTLESTQKDMSATDGPQVLAK